MRISGALCAAVLTVGLTGCLSLVVPDHDGKAQNGQTTSGDMAGGGTDDMGSSDDGGGGQPDLLDCIPQSAQVLDGHHNEGTDCLTCHDGNTAGAPKFTIAGTIYDKLTGGNPVAAVTVEITDANNQKIPIVTATTPGKGNFWYDLPVAFPVKVRASSCPTNAPMVATVDQTGGSCNKCHDTTNRAHLP